mmetsp:Transcript_4106/g.5759  ORF Transcript_4106/g.5759 Transcript_4106/m.5759 type:complete len:314 (-) Transcript_4106:77-1018(-)
MASQDSDVPVFPNLDLQRDLLSPYLSLEDQCQWRQASPECNRCWPKNYFRDFANGSSNFIKVNKKVEDLLKEFDHEASAEILIEYSKKLDNTLYLLFSHLKVLNGSQTGIQEFDAEILANLILWAWINHKLEDIQFYAEENSGEENEYERLKLIRNSLEKVSHLDTVRRVTQHLYWDYFSVDEELWRNNLLNLINKLESNIVVKETIPKLIAQVTEIYCKNDCQNGDEYASRVDMLFYVAFVYLQMETERFRFSDQWERFVEENYNSLGLQGKELVKPEDNYPEGIWVGLDEGLLATLPFYRNFQLTQVFPQN